MMTRAMVTTMTVRESTSSTRRVRLLALCGLTAAALLVAGCTDQRLPAKPGWVEAALALDSARIAEARAASEGMSAFRENFTDARNVVEAFLRAAETRNLDVLGRVLAPDFRLQQFIEGTTADAVPLLPGAAHMDYGTPADELAMMTEDGASWRWSALSHRIHVFSGIGAPQQVAAGLDTQVTVELAPGLQDYRLQFTLDREAAGQPWHISRIQPKYDKPEADDTGARHDYSRSTVPDSDLRSGLPDPVDYGRLLLNAAACRALVPADNAGWLYTMPTSLQTATAAQQGAISQWRDTLLKRLDEYQALKDVTYEGGYAEQTLQLPDAGTTSCLAVVRLLFHSTASDALLADWSVRVQLRSTLDNQWAIVWVDRYADKSVWPPNATNLRKRPPREH